MKKLHIGIAAAFLFAASTYSMEERTPIKRFAALITKYDKEDTSSENVLRLLNAYYYVPSHERAEAYSFAEAHGINLTDLLGEENPGKLEISKAPQSSPEDVKKELFETLFEIRLVQRASRLHDFQWQVPRQYRDYSLGLLGKIQRNLIDKMHHLEKVFSDEEFVKIASDVDKAFNDQVERLSS